MAGKQTSQRRRAPLRKTVDSDRWRFKLFLAVTQAIHEAPTYQAAIEVALREVCEATGWDFGEAWIPCTDGTALACCPSWYGRTKSLEKFRALCEGLTFPPGIGLPGRVWASKRPEWIQDISVLPDKTHPRAKIAKGFGIKAALGVPIIANDEVLAVLGFFMLQSRREDKRLVEDVSAVATQLGWVIQHKQAEEELRQSEARLQAILDNSTAVIFLKDTRGCYMLVNREYEKLFHITREQIKGQTDYDIFPKEMADAFRKNDLQVVEAKAPLKFEETVPQDDGVHIYIANKFPMFDSAGVAYAVCGIATDITERKLAEERGASERKRAETWLQSLIDTTQDAIISIDRQGRIVLFNPAAEQMFGYKKAEIDGRKINLLMTEPHASEHDRYIARYEQTRERRAIGRIRTVVARRKNGEVFPAELSLTEVTTLGEVRYAAFLRDISEKVRLQEELIETERLAAIGTTAAKLAHEIGNPLNGMYMTVQLLERRLARRMDAIDDTVKSSMQTLKDEITHLNQLLYEFRSLSRREKYNFRPTALAAVAAEVLDMERPRYAALGIHVEEAFPADLPLVIADSEKLKQALLNLCKNAVEAMPQGGTLVLRARNSKEQVVLEVVDTGLGIPDGVDIFEPFATTKPWGTGLGLVIVRQIVAAHEGTITYASERGKGTVFSLSLPLGTFPPTTP
ncbi:MAG: PAS domain S-box protein [Deltaproteobacteria bacterium]|nr:PAS domain S-box protein [Deltaproteobacteria bacterium]